MLKVAYLYVYLYLHYILALNTVKFNSILMYIADLPEFQLDTDRLLPVIQVILMYSLKQSCRDAQLWLGKAWQNRRGRSA